MVQGWVCSTQQQEESGCLVPVWLGLVASEMPLQDMAADALHVFALLPQSLTVNWENIIVPSPLCSPRQEVLEPSCQHSQAALLLVQCRPGLSICCLGARRDHTPAAGTRVVVLGACCRRMEFLLHVSSAFCTRAVLK